MIAALLTQTNRNSGVSEQIFIFNLLNLLYFIIHEIFQVVKTEIFADGGLYNL